MRYEVGPKSKPSDETFVRIWAHGSKAGWSLHEVAQRLNMPYIVAYHYARKLAHAGVNLPLLNGQRQRSTQQISKLNSIIKGVLASKEAVVS